MRSLSASSPVWTLAVSVVALAACVEPGAPQPQAAPLVDLVDPTIGTGGFGFAYGATFLGAAAPHGLVKVGPDTTGDFGELRFIHTSGNWANDDTILCFSHLHLHGTGLPEGGVLALMPTTSFDPERTRATHYQATRVDEVATPGAYSVRLLEPEIAVELAAPSGYAASWRIRYPAGTEDAVVVLDLFRTLIEGTVTEAQVIQDGSQLVGSLHTVGSLSPPEGYTVFFAIDAREPFGFVPTEHGGALSFGARDAASPVELHVGLSLVDEAGAQNNLTQTLPVAVTHDEARAQATALWSALLSRVRITGGTADEQTIFASALYRSFLMPTIMSDVDGRYRITGGAADPTGSVIRTADGFSMMTDLSLWDTYRTVQPLYALIAPERARDVALSLVAFSEALGWAPLWPMANSDARVMVGSPTEIVLGDALMRGVVRAADLEPAWPVLRAAVLADEEPAAGRVGRNGAPVYRAEGGIQPAPFRGPVSTTLELNAADLALSRVARALGHDDDADALQALSLGWRTLYDADTGFLRGRDEAGAFSVPTAEFFPEDFSDDYVEANAWQSMFPIDDIAGIRSVYGDPLARLTELLDLTEADWALQDRGSETFGIQPLPHHWQGNEPSLHVSALPYELGDDALGVRFVSFVMRTQYGAGVDGLPGNDDGGATSAWWAMAALGLFPVAGGADWVIGAPLFDTAEVDTARGTLTIRRATTATGAARTLDGRAAGPRVGHAQLIGARSLNVAIDAAE